MFFWAVISSVEVCPNPVGLLYSPLEILSHCLGCYILCLRCCYVYLATQDWWCGDSTCQPGQSL